MCDIKIPFMKNFLFVVGILFAPLLLATSQLPPWASPSQWSSLECYAKTITAGELEERLQKIYVPDGSWKNWITITPQAAWIEPYPGAGQCIELPLAASPDLCQRVPRYWKKHPEAHATQNQPLTGLRIVLDPGHLGGAWSKMEERWFRIGHSRPVEEGTMALMVAKHLAKRLRALGAEVCFTRIHNGPTTPLRPSQLRQAAIAEFNKEHVCWTSRQLKKKEEMLFYRTAEIHHRAVLINQKLQPDLVICMHFNAEDWNDPHRPTLTTENHLHFLIGGDFNASELSTEEDRYTMLRKLLGRSHKEEVGVATAVAKTFVAATGLPPFIYHNPLKARPASENPYLWNRNLLATRLIEAPVLYCEAYVMNNAQVFQRIQLGDYKGMRAIGCQKFPSIYREYADAVAQGLCDYFRK